MRCAALQMPPWLDRMVGSVLLSSIASRHLQCVELDRRGGDKGGLVVGFAMVGNECARGYVCCRMEECNLGVRNAAGRRRTQTRRSGNRSRRGSGRGVLGVSLGCRRERVKRRWYSSRTCE
jgi:hypothetical protein